MKKAIFAGLAILLSGCATSYQALPTATWVNLNQYVGTWYEQARLPNRFQKDCVADVQADYTLQPGHILSVVNQCRSADGQIKQAQGVGRLAGDGHDPTKLQVRFAPAWTSWLPTVWGDYWILKLEGNDRYSLVGTPNREFLWVLSRDKQADQDVVDALLNYAGTLGFAIEKVEKTAQ